MNQLPLRKTQTGAVLITSLIILLVLTVLGIGGMRATSMGEKMALNLRDKNIAFEAAEAALRDANNWLDNNPNPAVCTSSPCSTIYKKGVMPNVAIETHTWWTGFTDVDGVGIAHAHEYRTAGTKETAEAASDPRFVIAVEAYITDSLRVGHGKKSGRSIYRTVGRGTGATDTTHAILQSSYALRTN